jgi:3-deoxy-D-manno-octulosonic acid (KDO) 8-phosphate synthase
MGGALSADDLIVDPRSLVWLREAGCPVVADITHSLQQPGGRKVRTTSAELVKMWKVSLELLERVA